MPHTHTHAHTDRAGFSLWQVASRKRNNPDTGFSLMELLVVVAILAVLAAIAIPAFLNQKQKAKTATSQTDAHNLVINAKTAANNYPTGAVLPAQFFTDASTNFRGTPGGVTALWRNCALDGSDQLIVSDGNWIAYSYAGTTYAEAIQNYALYDSKTNSWRRGTSAGGTSTAYNNNTYAGAPQNSCVTNTGAPYGASPQWYQGW